MVSKELAADAAEPPEVVALTAVFPEAMVPTAVSPEVAVHATEPENFLAVLFPPNVSAELSTCPVSQSLSSLSV